MKIAFGCDHAAFDHREPILAALRDAGHTVLDFGTKSPESVDYPDYVGPVAEAVAAGQAERAVVICGSAVGASIVANKVKGVRCALVTDTWAAEMSRRHNDANALALRSREQTLERNLEIMKIWLSTPYEGGRHDRRLQKIAAREDRGLAAVPRRHSR
jgi:ribose 5-phosphate isomerase B